MSQAHYPAKIYRTQSLVLCGQATKRTRWMPWHLEAMKDVGACDKLGGAGKRALYPEISEWGNPPAVRPVSPPEYIGQRKRTRGTETSKYPEE